MCLFIIATSSDDLTTSSLILSFVPCQIQSCAALQIIDDDIIERNKSFYYMLERTIDLDERIKLDSTVGELVILNDDNGMPLTIGKCYYDYIIISVMSVGFTSTTYTGTETTGDAKVCVEILNPPSGGAIQPFSVTILSGEGICVGISVSFLALWFSLAGEESSNQYILECSRELYFQKGDSVQCHEYKINQDEVCELKENATHFELRLSVTDTDQLSIDNEKSTAAVTIDDSSEPECCE